MAKRKTAKNEVITAAAGLLAPYYPGITSETLTGLLEANSMKPKLLETSSMKRRMSPREYADMMGVSRDTVMRLLHAGELELEVIRIGRQYRILI